jgi:transcription initiation factor IIE alpha subunit
MVHSHIYFFVIKVERRFVMTKEIIERLEHEIVELHAQRRALEKEYDERLEFLTAKISRIATELSHKQALLEEFEVENGCLHPVDARYNFSIGLEKGFKCKACGEIIAVEGELA